MPAKKKEILTVEQGRPFMFIALSTTLNLNKLLWAASNHCGLRLVRNAELEQLIGVSSFTDRTSKPGLIVSLFPNRSSNGLVVGQLPNVDYIVEINGNTAEAEVKILSACLRGFQGIQAAITINPSKIKISEPFCPE